MIYDIITKTTVIMSDIRFSIEITYIDVDSNFITRRYIFQDGTTTMVRIPIQEVERYQIENNSIADEFMTSTENSLTILEAFFLFSEMMSTPSIERSMLEQAMRVSSEESDLQRDSSKHIAISLRKYKKECDKDHTCVICSDEFIGDEEVCVLSCNHIFHKHCIEEWGHYKAECPLCKKSIPLVKENIDNDKDGMDEN